jgi:hypothetical protein
LDIGDEDPDEVYFEEDYLEEDLLDEIEEHEDANTDVAGYEKQYSPKTFQYTVVKKSSIICAVSRDLHGHCLHLRNCPF